MNGSIFTTEGASKEAIETLKAKYPNLPEEYFFFLEKTNGAEGPLGINPGWFVIWSAEEALVATDEYQMPTYLPGYFCFGGNGGGELFLFPINVEANAQIPILMAPAIGIKEDSIIQIASNFHGFEAAIGSEWEEDA